MSNMTVREAFERTRGKRRYLWIDVPALGRKVRIRSLTEKEKSDFEQSLLTKKATVSRDRLVDSRARLVAMVVVEDDSDNLVFSERDLEWLGEVDGAVTSVIFNGAQEHCGFEKNDIEDLVKNSDSVRVDDSP